MQKANFRDYLKLHFIVVILGFTAILGKLTAVSSPALVFYRTLFAALGIGVLAISQNSNLKIGFKKALPLLGVGTLMSFHWICFFGSAKLSTVAISLVAVSTTAFFTSLIEPLFKQKKVSFIEVMLGIVVVIGLALIFAFEFKHFEGLMVGLLSAFIASIFSILNSQFAFQYESRQVIFFEMLGACLSSVFFLGIFLFFDKDLIIIPTKIDWIWISILGFGCSIYPYLGMQNLLKKISAYTLNLSINLEPVYGIILGYLIFGEKEKMNLGFYFGTIVILLTVIAYPILQKRKK